MRIWKWVGVAVGALVGLFVIAAILVTLFVDPNDYKDDIERLAEQQTGRPLTLEGDLHLAVFPWLAIEFGPARLGDAPGFGDEPFVAVDHASLGIRLWPLLRGKVEIGTVRIDGMAVRLVTDAQGRNNWADLTAAEPSTAPTPPDGANSLSTTTLAGLDIRNAAISLEDRRDKSRIALSELTLTTGALASGKAFDLNTAFLVEQTGGPSVQTEMTARVTADLERNVHVIDKPVIKATLLGSDFPAGGLPLNLGASKATLDVGHEQHVVEALEMETSWRGEGLPETGVPVKLRVASLQADLAAQTLSLAGLDLDAAGAKVTGQMSGKEILDAPRLTGQLALAPVQLRAWLPKLGIKLPVTRDPEAIKSLEFKADVALTTTSADFENLDLKLDDTTARGTLGVADFDALAVRFALDVDRIDADRYLAPESPKAAAGKESTAPPVEIPVKMIRQLNVRGTLNLGEARLAGIRFSKVRLGVTARDGNLRFNPAEATVYGGQYRGDVGIAAASDVARVTLDQRLTNVDFAPLFKDLFETSRLSGKGNFTSQLNANGRDSAALLKSMNGTLDFAVNDGAFEGTDLWYEIRRARAVLKGQGVPSRTGPERTEFTALKGSGTVKDGVLTSNDLTMAMQYLRVAGKATVDLPRSEIDSRVEATVLKIPAEGADTAGLKELVNARIPVRITGSLDSPKVLPDVEGYLKDEVNQRLEQEKDKAIEKLQDRLKRMLGR